jgi:hypothetical protein
MLERRSDDGVEGVDLEDDEPVAAGPPLVAVDAACRSILDQLHGEAVELATGFMEAMLRAREAHPYRERGSIGVRVRRAPAPRSAPGVFLIEWFRVRGQQRTESIARGAGHRYLPRAFGRIEPWERTLIETYEPRFAEIRALLHQVATLRRQARRLRQALDRWEEGAIGRDLTDGA